MESGFFVSKHSYLSLTIERLGADYEHKIEMLYVLPQHMNKGIGSTLLQYVLDNYKETLEIGVSKGNPVSMHIYKKHGFVITRDEDYDVSGIYSPHYIMIREYKN